MRAGLAIVVLVVGVVFLFLVDAADWASFLILIIVTGGGLALYFLPTIIAVRSEALNQTAVLFLNIFVGWTLIGWLVSLFWALAGAGTARSVKEQAALLARQRVAAHAAFNSAHVKCPKCAEMVKREAVVCRFCGHEFAHATPVTPLRRLTSPLDSNMVECGNCGRISVRGTWACPQCNRLLYHPP